MPSLKLTGTVAQSSGSGPLCRLLCPKMLMYTKGCCTAMPRPAVPTCAQHVVTVEPYVSSGLSAVDGKVSAPFALDGCQGLRRVAAPACLQEVEGKALAAAP